MRRRTKIATMVVLLVTAVAGCATRHSLGRTRPDLAALLSVDDGLFGFAETYTKGAVGPFRVGDTREATIDRVENIRLFPDDQAQLQEMRQNWRLAIPAKSGGYAIYTLRFENERVVSVRAYYSVFAGL